MEDPTKIASQLIKVQVNYSNQFFFQRKLGIKRVDKDVPSQELSTKCTSHLKPLHSSIRALAGTFTLYTLHFGSPEDGEFA